MSAADEPLTEPTDPAFEHEPVERELRPWYDPDTGFSQEPFLAAPEGFATPYPVSEDVHFHGFVSGIGAGKTTCGIIRTIANCQEWNPGETGMIVAPTVPHLKNVILPEMRKWGLLDIVRHEGKGSDEPGLHFPSGSRVILESADNDRKIERLRGPSISWFWIDEAAHLPQKVWEILVGRLRTGRYRNGFITTTPKGFNWVYDRFYGGGEGPPDDVNLVYGVPSNANPHLPDDYESITAEFGGHYHEQEVKGRFVQPEGLVFPEFGQGHLCASPPPNPSRVFYGVDWGFSSPSAIVAIVEDRHGGYTVVEEFYERRCTTEDLAEVANAMQGRWGVGTFYCDAAEPDSIETFKRHGLDAVEAHKDVNPGIKTVTSKLSDLQVREPCTNLINEMNQYHYPEDEEDPERPVEKNDHAIDALRYALHTYTQQGSFSTGVVSGDLYSE